MMFIQLNKMKFSNTYILFFMTLVVFGSCNKDNKDVKNLYIEYYGIESLNPILIIDIDKCNSCISSIHDLISSYSDKKINFVILSTSKKKHIL